MRRARASVRRHGAAIAAVLLALSPGVAAAQPSTASPRTPETVTRPPDAKPYDDKLVRLAEILGAVHYLRELCGQNDGQQWRERMRELIETDGGSALRRSMLARSFNNGYRSYGRTYQSCTPSAQTAIGRFIAEGAQLAEGLAKGVP